MACADPYGLVGTDLANRFRIERAVAEGGFGVVYRAEHLTLGTHVAIKVLKVPEGVPKYKEIYESFVKEAKMVAKLRHPNIVRVIDLGKTVMPTGSEAPWMALEWLDGETLREYFRTPGNLPMRPTQALKFFKPVFEALACAHSDGIAHRDIKPANIMLMRGQLLLMDFGIAKLMEDGEAAGSGTRTASAFVTYTLRYASYEQVAGKKSGPWTDCHALALLLTEVLVGQPAYRSDKSGLMAEVMSHDRPTPKTFGIDVGAWEAVIARGLTSDANQRWRHAREFLDALEKALPLAEPQGTHRVETTITETTAATHIGPTIAKYTATTTETRRVTHEATEIESHPTTVDPVQGPSSVSVVHAVTAPIPYREGIGSQPWRVHMAPQPIPHAQTAPRARIAIVASGLVALGASVIGAAYVVTSRAHTQNTVPMIGQHANAHAMASARPTLPAPSSITSASSSSARMPSIPPAELPARVAPLTIADAAIPRAIVRPAQNDRPRPSNTRAPRSDPTPVRSPSGSSRYSLPVQ